MARKYASRKITKSACPTGFAFDHKGSLVKLLCGKWNCPHCGRVNARMWAWRVRIQIKSNGDTAYFWTLTMGSAFLDAQTAFQALPKLWDTFRKIVQRNTVGVFDYCAFVEGQPKRGGMPHFHIISLTKSPRRLKDLAVQAGFGFQAKETRINGPKAAAYVAKYSTKSGENFPSNLRRVRASRGWAKLPPYAGYPLIVKSRNETTTAYLLRVHEITGTGMDDLFDRWQKGVQRFDDLLPLIDEMPVSL